MIKYTYQEIAKITGKHKNTIINQLNASTVTCEDQGPGKAKLWPGWNALLVIAEVDLRNAGRLQPDGPASGDDECVIDYNVEKARAEKARADKLELANAEKRGELLDAASVVERWSTEVINAKTKLLSIPSKVSVLIEDDEERRRIFADVNELIHDILNELGGQDDN